MVTPGSTCCREHCAAAAFAGKCLHEEQTVGCNGASKVERRGMASSSQGLAWGDFDELLSMGTVIGGTARFGLTRDLGATCEVSGCFCQGTQ